jgi:hypothetical protein
VVVDDLLELAIHEREGSHWMDLLEAGTSGIAAGAHQSRRGSPTGGLAPTYHRPSAWTAEVSVPFYLYFTAS